MPSPGALHAFQVALLVLLIPTLLLLLFGLFVLIYHHRATAEPDAWPEATALDDPDLSSLA
jgi:cation transporter-like permease